MARPPLVATADARNLYSKYCRICATHLSGPILFVYIITLVPGIEFFFLRIYSNIRNILGRIISGYKSTKSLK